jgi:predicted nucleotidyltransferase component of viral defense system
LGQRASQNSNGTDMTTSHYIKPLRVRFQEERSRLGITWEIIEQDYLLSWMLAAISSIPLLKKTLVFKGGTALKKCYFEDYRFSQDLDFSTTGTTPKGKDLLVLMKQACKVAENLIEKQNSHITIKCEPYREKQPHPFGQEAFTILAQYPWHNKHGTRVMVEITMAEPVLKIPVQMQILHGYGEAIDHSINVYSLDEVVAEKIRAILQYAEKLHERGWGRSRARDYYDLWRILTQKSAILDLPTLEHLIIQKCAVKGIVFTSIDNLFTQELMNDLAKAWSEWLSPLVPDLPNLDIVLAQLKTSLMATISSSKKDGNS